MKVVTIRRRTGLSQTEFARTFGLEVATLRNWEQGRARPDGPARVLLTLIGKDPRLVADMLGSDYESIENRGHRARVDRAVFAAATAEKKAEEAVARATAKVESLVEREQLLRQWIARAQLVPGAHYRPGDDDEEAAG